MVVNKLKSNQKYLPFTQILKDCENYIWVSKFVTKYADYKNNSIFFFRGSV